MAGAPMLGRDDDMAALAADAAVAALLEGPQTAANKYNRRPKDVK